MTAQTPEVSAAESARWTADEEIDLTQYLIILVQWWREAVAITLVVALLITLAAYAWRSLREPVYKASATAVIARVFSDVTLDERFQTLSDGNTPNSNNNNAWRASLVGLVNNGQIAQRVLAQVNELLPEEERDPSLLLERIGAELALGADGKTQSNLIRITAEAETAATASAIANAWVSEYILHINSIYGSVPAEVAQAVESELQAAKLDYDDAQSVLEGFVGNNLLTSLIRKIDEKQTMLDSLQISKQTAISAVTQRDRDVRLRQFRSLSDAQINSSFAVLDEQITYRLQELTAAYSARPQAAQFLDQILLMQDQVESGEEAAAASNHMAIQLLKSQIYAAPLAPAQADLKKTGTIDADGSIALLLPVTPNRFDLNIDMAALNDSSQAEQLADIAALGAALEHFIEQLDERIGLYSEELLAGKGYAYLEQFTPDQLTLSSGTGSDIATDNLLNDAIIQSYEALFGVGDLVHILQGDAPNDTDELTTAIGELESEIQTLKASLEAENARQSQLTQQRDLAWNAFDTLSRQLVELNLEQTAANSEVRMGAPALTPTEPEVILSLRLVLAAALIVGMILAALVTIICALMQVTPFFSRRSVPSAA